MLSYWVIQVGFLTIKKTYDSFQEEHLSNSEIRETVYTFQYSTSPTHYISKTVLSTIIRVNKIHYIEYVSHGKWGFDYSRTECNQGSLLPATVSVKTDRLLKVGERWNVSEEHVWEDWRRRF